MRFRRALLPIIGTVFLVVATVLATGAVYRVGAQGQGQGTDPEAVASAGASAVSRVQATTPLRWRIPWATVEIGTFATLCTTAINVRNLADATVNVEVEFFSTSGTLLENVAGAVAAGAVENWLPDGQSNINAAPFAAAANSGTTGDFEGYANVHADDPRILVSAHILCRNSTADPLQSEIVAITNEPAFPVGATLQFFQAHAPGVPAGQGLATMPPAEMADGGAEGRQSGRGPGQ